MERFFIFEKFNTWYSWDLILTGKNIAPPEPKTNLVNIDGMSGSLDLSEALTGGITYEDRTVEASFWTNVGNYKDREKLLRKITSALHGKKVKIIEPDDPDHYFLGRVTVKDYSNSSAFLDFKLEAKCEPWRYALTESIRRVEVNSLLDSKIVINNNGVKTLCPEITVTGSVTITYEGVTTNLNAGTYKISDIKLRQGVNVVSVSGNGSVTFKYREGDL